MTSSCKHFAEANFLNIREAANIVCRPDNAIAGSFADGCVFQQEVHDEFFRQLIAFDVEVIVFVQIELFLRPGL